MVTSLEKKLDRNYTRMLHSVLNKSWKRYPTKQQLYSHLLPISWTIQLIWARHAEYCWRSKKKLISNVRLWTLTYGHRSVDRSIKILIHQLQIPSRGLANSNGWMKSRESVLSVHLDEQLLNYVAQMTEKHQSLFKHQSVILKKKKQSK